MIALPLALTGVIGVLALLLGAQGRDQTLAVWMYVIGLAGAAVAALAR